MKQKPPSDSRPVLTWARDRQGIEVWQIDSYNTWGDPPFWSEAQVWEMKVLFWKELDPKPDYEEGE